MTKEIHLDKSKSIKYIQDIFQSTYPFLRIVFFSPEQKTKSRKELDPNLTLSELTNDLLPGVIQLDGSKKVGDLEAELKKRFGLNAQIYRRSGYSWIQTTLTDNWTLEKQNKEGEMLYNAQVNPKDEIIDKDLWDPE